MLDITYPLFGGAVFLTTLCAACLWGQVSQLRRRLAVLETRPVTLQLAPTSAPTIPYLDPQPPPQHTEVYIPPRPSAPPAVVTGLYYHDHVPRTAVI